MGLDTLEVNEVETICPVGQIGKFARTYDSALRLTRLAFTARRPFDHGDHVGPEAVRDFGTGLQFGQGSRFRSLNHMRSGAIDPNWPRMTQGGRFTGL